MSYFLKSMFYYLPHCHLTKKTRRAVIFSPDCKEKQLAKIPQRKIFCITESLYQTYRKLGAEKLHCLEKLLNFTESLKTFKIKKNYNSLIIIKKL